MNSDERNRLTATATFTEYLKAHRMRCTPERLKVVGHALEMPRHFSVEQLHDMIELSGYHLSLATVYNTVQLMIDAGVVRRHTFAGKTAEYERADRSGGNHLHLVCTVCGKVKEVRDTGILSDLQGVRFPAFHTTTVDLTAYGTCSRCRRKSRSR